MYRNLKFLQECPQDTKKKMVDTMQVESLSFYMFNVMHLQQGQGFSCTVTAAILKPKWNHPLFLVAMQLTPEFLLNLK